MPRFRFVGGQQAGPEILEVLVEGAAGDAGQLGDARCGEAAVALLGERGGRCLEQPQALVRPHQVGGDAVAAGGRRSGACGLGLGGLGEGGAGDQPQLGHPSPASSTPISRARSRSSKMLARSKAPSACLLAEVGAGGEVHQLRQRVPDAARVAGAERLADAGLDPADDEDAGRLGRRLGRVDLGAGAVDRGGEALDRRLVPGQRRLAGDLHLDEERPGDRRPRGDELEERGRSPRARPPPNPVWSPRLRGR